MNAAYTIFRRELGAYFNTAIGYVFMIFFLAVSSAFYVTSLFESGRAGMSDFFNMMPILFLFFVPAVTMRLWAEERKSGTMELLLTMPVTSWQAVLGKFFAGWAFLTVTLLFTFPLPLALVLLNGNPDPGPIIGGYLGTMILGMIYMAIGLFASSLTADQIVAFVAALAVSFFFYLTGFDPVVAWLSDLSKPLGQAVAAVGIDTHFYSISRGVVDSRDVLYALSVTGFFLFLCVLSIERKR
jgi:ABC-2 type transport system permease protein